MLTQVRLHQWETNSSSMHELILSSEGLTKVPKKIEINVGEFGWGFDLLRSVEDRISYIVSVLACSAETVDEFEEWYAKLINFLKDSGVEEVDDSHIRDKDYIDSLAKTAWRCKYNVMGLPSYVDHESLDDSAEILQDLLDNNHNDLYNLIFNGKSFIIIGNDNFENYGANDDWSIEEEQNTEVW